MIISIAIIKQGTNAALKVLKMYWISNVFFKTVKMHWI